MILKVFSNSHDSMQFLTLLLPPFGANGTLKAPPFTQQSLAFLSPNPKIRVTSAPVFVYSFISLKNHHTSSQNNFNKFLESCKTAEGMTEKQ